ncbi:MAG TPA: site-specific integrase [Candidatus Deferrimicrobiaceae bacterium]|jgi:integrase
MPGGKMKLERTKTDYPGVWHIVGTGLDGKPERIYYIGYRVGGKWTEEKAGRARRDSMTPARAAAIRSRKIEGKAPTNEGKREAEREARTAETGRWTIDRLWTEWKKVNADKKGVVKDNSRYNVHIKAPFGDIEPKDIDPLSVRRLSSTLVKGKRGKKPLAVSTVVSVLTLLRRIEFFGKKSGLCEGLSFTIELPKGSKQKTEDMTETQMSQYVKTCREWKDSQAGAFQLLALFTGMRRAEIRGLKWVDVDDDRGFIHIRDPKGGTDQKIPMNDPTLELVKTIPHVKGSPYVFTGEMGGMIGLKQVGASAKDIRDAAGLPADFRPLHGLRHTFASHLASSGEVDLFTLQKLLTHKSPLMTQRYAHLRDDSIKRASNVMGRIVAGATAPVAVESGE